jgi:hypothetical protein
MKLMMVEMQPPVCGERREKGELEERGERRARDVAQVVY